MLKIKFKGLLKESKEGYSGKVVKEESLRESEYMGFKEKEPLLKRGFYNVGIDDNLLAQIKKLAMENKNIKNIIEAYKLVASIQDDNMKSMAIDYFMRHFGGELDRFNLKRVNLEASEPERVNLHRANLEGADLEGADLSGVNLKGANLEGANLEGVNLKGADLGGADLMGANLTKANLVGANLKRAILRWANLVGADLRTLDLRGAKLKGAKYNSETRFPEGFNSEGRGMVLVQED